jgi:hypothetical protein
VLSTLAPAQDEQGAAPAVYGLALMELFALSDLK